MNYYFFFVRQILLTGPFLLLDMLHCNLAGSIGSLLQLHLNLQKPSHIVACFIGVGGCAVFLYVT